METRRPFHLALTNHDMTIFNLKNYIANQNMVRDLKRREFDLRHQVLERFLDEKKIRTDPWTQFNYGHVYGAGGAVGTLDDDARYVKSNEHFVPAHRIVKFPLGKFNIHTKIKCLPMSVTGLREDHLERSHACRQKYIQCDYCCLTTNRKNIKALLQHYVDHFDIFVEELPCYTENDPALQRIRPDEDLYEASGVKISTVQLFYIHETLIQETEKAPPYKPLFIVTSVRNKNGDGCTFICPFCLQLGKSINDMKEHLKVHITLVECLVEPVANLCLTDKRATHHSMEL